MLHTKFKVIGLLLMEKKIFKVLTIYGHGGHVGLVTQLICINFHSHFSLSCHTSFDFKSPNCFCEKQVCFNLEICVTFDQAQRIALTFDTHSTSLTHLVDFFKQG